MNESTKLEFRYRRIGQLSDVSDLAEILFPGNRNQQHAFLVIWVTLKWANEKVVSDLADVAERNAVSRRTLERARAKMKRLGIIEHVSRFSRQNNYRDGWVLSGRFENGLRQLAGKIENLKNSDIGSREKDDLLLQLADARSASPGEGCSRSSPHGTKMPSRLHALGTVVGAETIAVRVW